MKTLPAGLQAHLDSGATTLAWCWRIERADGAVFGFTDHDRPLAFAGTDFEPESGFAASEIRAGSDLSVDAQDAEGALTLGPHHRDRHPRRPLGQRRGRGLAGELGRAGAARADAPRRHRPDPARPARLRRRGALARALLNQTVGRTFQFMPATPSSATPAAASISTTRPSGDTGSVAAVIGDRGFRPPRARRLRGRLVRPRPSDLDQRRRTPAGRAEIARHDRRSRRACGSSCFEAPVRPIGAGDDFVVRAGCDKRFATCKAKFANVVNFRGFPQMPGDDVGDPLSEPRRRQQRPAARPRVA